MQEQKKEEMKTPVLPLKKKKWCDMIASGEKTEGDMVVTMERYRHLWPYKY